MNIKSFCHPDFLSGTAGVLYVTFNKNIEDNVQLWISPHATVDTDDLKYTEWKEARRLLPLPEQVDALLADMPHGIIEYSPVTREWGNYPLLKSLHPAHTAASLN